MNDENNRIRIAIQKLTEAIWNLDQLQPLDKGLEEEYVRIQLAREHLMKQVKKGGSA
jgi:ribosome recycling factor